MVSSNTESISLDSRTGIKWAFLRPVRLDYKAEAILKHKTER